MLVPTPKPGRSSLATRQSVVRWHTSRRGDGARLGIVALVYPGLGASIGNVDLEFK
jgi:hypothetical protein